MSLFRVDYLCRNSQKSSKLLKSKFTPIQKSILLESYGLINILRIILLVLINFVPHTRANFNIEILDKSHEFQTCIFCCTLPINHSSIKKLKKCHIQHLKDVSVLIFVCLLKRNVSGFRRRKNCRVCGFHICSWMSMFDL